MKRNHHVYGSVCVECGAHLDPGERCDCEQHMAEIMQQKRKRKAAKTAADNAAAVEHGWEEWLNG